MWISVFILTFLLFGPSQATNEGKCEITNITEDKWEIYLQPTEKVYDDANNKVIFQSPYTKKLTNLECKCTSNSCNPKHDYITIENNVAESNFIISTSDHMTDLDMDTKKTSNSYINVVYNCTMKCNTDQSSTLTIYIDIYDKNNHAPEFEEESYSYKVASPIMPVTDFTLYGASIRAQDLDFSNTKMTYTIEPNDFDITTTVDSSNTKKYVANIRANKVLTVSSPKTYVLTATDGGTDPGPLDTSVTITIDVDETLSLDIPYFEYPDDNLAAYKFDYDSNENKLTPLTGTITLNTNSPNSVTDIQLLGEMKDSFKVKFDATSKTFEISSPATIENPTSSSTALTLSLKTDIEASTPIIIQFSNVPSSAVTFKEHSYTGSYDDVTNVVTMDENIELILTTSEAPKFTITGDFSENFSIDFDEDKKVCTIVVKKNLTPEQILSKTYLSLIVEATVDKDSDKSVMVIQLPTHKLQFTSVLYSATYNADDDTVIIDADNPIGFTTNVKYVEITVDEQYSEYFQITDKFTIDVATPLPAEILSSQTELALVLTAKDAYSNQQQAVVKMILPLQETIEAPKFSKPYYAVTYVESATVIDFTDPLTFDNVDDPSLVTITLSEYGEYFEVNYHSNKWQLHVKKALDVEIFNENQNLILIMEATQTETQETGQSVLVIELLDNSVESKIPEFEEAYYTAIYPSEGKGTITFDKDINFDNVDDINRVTISIPDYTENFNVIYNPTSNQWLINIVKPLDDDTLSSNTYLTSTLSATIEEDNHTPVTAFVLKLPDHESESEPIFSKSYFVAQYSIEDEKAKVTLEDNIEFSNDVDDNNIQIVADEYSEYLSFTYDTQTKLWQVNTNGILDTSSLSRSELVVGITATDSTTKLQGRSVIDLKLPKVNNEDAPQFSRTYYKANYDMSTDTPSVILEDAIDILNRNDMSTITITTNEYRDYFEVSYNEKWQITVKKNLDQSILNNKVDIIMELIATDSKDTDQIGQSTLLITLPPVNNEEAPKFSSIFYESQCNSSTTILETSPIVINNKQVSSDITVRILEDDYKSNFEVKYNSEIKSWQVYVNSLPEDAAEEDLVLTLIATETDNENIGQAALVINFPPLEAPEFNSVQYHGDYKIVENTPALTVDDVIIVNKEDQKSNIHLKLSDSDQDLSNNFIYSYDDDKNIWKITLNEPLDDGYINGKTQLILTLTATEDGNKLTGSATVIISLPTDNDSENDLSFSDLHYEGNYVSPDEPEVQLKDDIHLISSQDLSNVVFMFDITENLNANSYFTIKKTSTDGDYVVSVTNPLPADILQNQRSLAVTLQATLGKNKASTTLVINLPIPGEENTIDFSKLLYTGSYSAIEGLNVEEITIITNENSNNLKVDISKDSPYYAYFKVTQTDKIVTLTSEDIPSDVIQKISVIPLTLIAQSSGTTKTGEAVINININNYQGSVQFDSPLFNGKYEIIENKVTVTVDPITLTTDIEDDLISVVVDKDMDKYFEASYNNSVVYLSSKLNIPDTLLVDSTLPVLLTASIKNTNSNTHTVVNLRIITDTQPNNTEILQFDGVLFTAQYSIENGKGKFEQDGDIGLTTNLQADEIDVQISGDSDLEKHFDISYKDQKVTVSLLKDISDDDFYSKSFISLTMIAKTLENSISTSAVLNIRLNNNQDADKRYISFERPVYNGNYIVENDVATIKYDNIIVNTDQEDNTVTSSIEEPYDKYFEVVYEDKTIKPMLKIKEANSVLRTYTNIAVVVSVKIKDTSLVAETVINFQVVDKDNGEKDDGAINFPKPVYNGVYNVDSNTLTQDDNIIIITQHPESDIEVEISNEYKYEKYFTVNFKNNEIAISLKENLPKDEVEKLGYIALAIRAKLKKNQKIFGDAVLNIKVQEKSRNNLGSNNNKYIIAVSVLSVLLFLVIIGVIALYFFIFRKNKYDRMTEEDYINSKVKFDKTKLKRGSTDRARSSAIEERRPTGFVFKGEGDEPRESTTDGPNMEGRKSVAFDENVEKIQIDGLNDDDIDKALRQTTEL